MSLEVVAQQAGVLSQASREVSDREAASAVAEEAVPDAEVVDTRISCS